MLTQKYSQVLSFLLPFIHTKQFNTNVLERVYLITNLQQFVCLVENDILYYFNYISELYDSCCILFYYIYYCHSHRAPAWLYFVRHCCSVMLFYYARNQTRFQKSFLVVYVNVQNVRQNFLFTCMSNVVTANTKHKTDIFFGNTYMKSLFEENTRTKYLNGCTHVIQLSIEIKRAFLSNFCLLS